MSATLSNTAVRNLCALYQAGALGSFTDAQLLDRFIDDRDEAAFEVLVRRHGMLVWGVCRRILGGHHDAEDAFQATFLVLARKAASIVPREVLPNWLHAVARRTAMKARAVAARRSGRESPMANFPEQAALGPKVHRSDERLEWLDLELGHLPERYRGAIILCELEGLTHQEAARRLECPVGTLSARLSRGRSLLARRLARHGVTTLAAGLSLWLARDAVSANIPASLAGPTARAAALFAIGRAMVPGLISLEVMKLANGVIKSLLFARLKILAITAALAAVLGSAMILQVHPTPTEGHGARRQAPRGQKAAEPGPTPAPNPDKQGPILAGRVVDENGRSLPGARIVLYSGIATRWKGQEATTDGDGRYRFDPLRTGAMIADAASGRWDWRPGMRVEHPTHVSADGQSWWDITVPNIDRREHVQDFRMVPGGWLAGRVLDPGTKAPLKRLHLTIESPVGRNPRFHTYARTDDEGRFRSEPLFPGEYAVAVNSTELGHPLLGKVQVEAEKFPQKEFFQDKLRWAIAMGVTAVSGKNRIEQLRAFTMSTRQTHDDGRISTTNHFCLQPDRYRRQIRFEGDDESEVLIITGASLQLSHKRDDGTVKVAQFQAATNPALVADRIKFLGPRAVLRLEDPVYRLTLLDDARVGDKAVFGIGLMNSTPGLKLEFRMFFDLDTGLLLQEENLAEGIVSVFEDFKEIHSIPVAHTMLVRTAAGKTFLRKQLIDLKVEETLPTRLFEAP